MELYSPKRQTFELNRKLPMPKKDKQPSQPKSPEKRQFTRNVLVSGGVIGTALTGNQWIKPAVNSAILPTHANMTIICPP